MCRMDRFTEIEEVLLGLVESQLGNLEDVCAKELGEVVDMIKDFEEAKYYCAVTEAMEESEAEEEVAWSKSLTKMSARDIKTLLEELVRMLEEESSEEKMSGKKM